MAMRNAACFLDVIYAKASLDMLPHETQLRITALVGSQRALARVSRANHAWATLVRQLQDDALAARFGRPVPSLSRRAVALAMDMAGAFDDPSGLMALPAAEVARSLELHSLLTPRSLEDLVVGGCASYEQMGLSAALLRSASEYGVRNPPTWLHQRLIRLIGTRRDALVHAGWGHESVSGTAVGLLQAIDPSLTACQAIVLEPTKESAVNAWGVYRGLAAGLGERSDEVRTCYIESETEEGVIVRLRAAPDVACPLAEVDAGVHVVCGAPGVMLRAIQRHELALDRLRFVVLEPLDNLVSRVYKRTLTELLELVPPSAQRLFFYDGGLMDGYRATAASLKLMHRFARDFLREPALLWPPRPRHEPTLDGVKQCYVVVEREDAKLEALRKLYSTISDVVPREGRLQGEGLDLVGAGQVGEARFAVLVFVNTRRKAEWLTNQVRTSMTPAVPCAAMHSDLDQQVCTALIEAFMHGELRMLIVRDEAIAPDGYVVRQSDYLAEKLQGTPLPVVVVNYDLPHDTAAYLLRVGRNRTLNRPPKGLAISFVTGNDPGNHEQRLLEGVRREFGARIDELPDAIIQEGWELRRHLDTYSESSEEVIA